MGELLEVIAGEWKARQILRQCDLEIEKFPRQIRPFILAVSIPILVCRGGQCSDLGVSTWQEEFMERAREY
jgi:hypothetical protein